MSAKTSFLHILTLGPRLRGDDGAEVGLTSASLSQDGEGGYVPGVLPLLRILPLALGFLMVFGAGSHGVLAVDEAALKELAPVGKLRAGLVFAPAATAFFVVKSEAGEPSGVTADLFAQLGQELGIPVEFSFAVNSGLITDAVESEVLDVGFMPVDEERKKRVAFGPAYALIESTYFATARSGIKTVEDADRQGMRLIGIANTTTIRAAARTLRNTAISPVNSVQEGVTMLLEDKADALALSRDAMVPLAAQVPGARIAAGDFQRTGIAIAVPKDRPHALALVTEFLNRAKASGAVRKALDRFGFQSVPVAP